MIFFSSFLVFIFFTFNFLFFIFFKSERKKALMLAVISMSVIFFHVCWVLFFFAWLYFSICINKIYSMIFVSCLYSLHIHTVSNQFSIIVSVLKFMFYWFIGEMAIRWRKKRSGCLPSDVLKCLIKMILVFSFPSTSRRIFQSFYLFFYHGESSKLRQQWEDKWNRNSTLTTRKVYQEPPQEKHLTLSSFVIHVASVLSKWIIIDFLHFSSLSSAFELYLCCLQIKFSHSDEWRRSRQKTDLLLFIIYSVRIIFVSTSDSKGKHLRTNKFFAATKTENFSRNHQLFFSSF